jgi:hypothetical protein
MIPPVESQVIFLSKETPIVSVGLRTAEVSYTNQNKKICFSQSKNPLELSQFSRLWRLSRMQMGFLSKTDLKDI